MPAPESLDLTTPEGREAARRWGLPVPAPGVAQDGADAQGIRDASGTAKARRRKPSPREKDVLRQCLQYLRARGIMCWRQNAGAFPLGEGKGRRYFRACEPGCSDIIACAGGRLWCIEVKRPGGKLRPAQRAFLARVVVAGGVGIVVRSVSELEAALDAEGL